MTIYAIVHLTGPMIYEEDSGKSPPTTSYSRTIEILKRIALYAKKKNGNSLVTYIGKRKVLQSDMKKEDPHRDPVKVITDLAFLGDQLENLSAEHEIEVEDTILIFSNAGGFLANVAKKPPCRSQLILMDQNYGDIVRSEFADLQALVDSSMDPLTKSIRAKEFKTLYYCKSKPHEILYRLLKDHFMPFTVRIWIGRMKQNVVLSPHCLNVPKGNLHVVGFLKSSSLLNMPVTSRHRLTPASVIGITRKEFKEQEKRKNKKKMRKHVMTLGRKICKPKNKRKHAPLMYMLKEALATEDCVAIGRFVTGRYCAIYSLKADPESNVREEFGLALLDIMQEFDFDRFVTAKTVDTSKAKDDNAQDIHISHLTDHIPSYANPNEKCWISAQGMNIDLQKIVRLFKKLPDKPEAVYQEINRIREYAILIGMVDFLKTLAEVIRSQIAQMTESAQQHGEHIATFLEKEVNPLRYDQIGMWESPQKQEQRILQESRHDKDERILVQQDIRPQRHDERRNFEDSRRDRDHRQHREDRHYDRYSRRHR